MAISMRASTAKLMSLKIVVTKVGLLRRRFAAQVTL
jgi:hypothetical protein